MPTQPAEQRREYDLRFDSIKNDIKDGFGRMENLLSGLDTRLRNVEQCQAGQQAAQGLQLEAHDKDITALLGRMSQVEAILDKLTPWVGAVKWLMGAFGLLMIGLLWDILTHGITLVH